MISKIRAYFRVRRGARLLDRKKALWWRRVDPKLLRLDDCEFCVIGQCFDSKGWLDAVKYLRGKHIGLFPWAFAYYRGFGNYRYDGPVDANPLYYTRWRKEIQKRRDRDMRARGLAE